MYAENIRNAEKLKTCLRTMLQKNKDNIPKIKKVIIAP